MQYKDPPLPIRGRVAGKPAGKGIGKKEKNTETQKKNDINN
jgi:hypothetical protein